MTTNYTGGLRKTAVLAWLRLARVYQRIGSRSAQHFHAHGLNTAQFDVLAQIGAAEGLTQQELADALLVTKGNISQLLARLEQRGLVVRRQAGRCNYLSLSAKGRTLYGTVVPQQEAFVADMFASLTPEEQAQLHGLLRKLDHNLQGEST